MNLAFSLETAQRKPEHMKHMYIGVDSFGVVKSGKLYAYAPLIKGVFISVTGTEATYNVTGQRRKEVINSKRQSSAGHVLGFIK